jgi:hypothetical protein
MPAQHCQEGGQATKAGRCAEKIEICKSFAVDGNFLGKFMIMIIKKAGFLFAVFCLAIASSAPKHQAVAYVLPSQQLLQFMAPHFSKFETLVITHTVERKDEEGVQSFEEILMMKSPGFVHARPVEGADIPARVIDRSFRTLFLSSTQAKLRDLLSGAGVDLNRVSYTLVDGAVAYLMGERHFERPQFAVEKAGFFPLLFSYSSHLAQGPEFIRVTFRDYRQVEEGWYPFDILCTSDAGWAEHYKIRSIQVNTPVDPSRLHPSQEPSGPAQGPSGEERIHSIIKAFEQKYGP